MIIAFLLSMPNRASWNGRWSGELDLHVIFKTLSGKRAGEKAHRILASRYYSYNFGDGWRASIEAKEVDPSERRKMAKANKGFCGYDWMVDSILQDGDIYGPTQPKPEPATA